MSTSGFCAVNQFMISQTAEYALRAVVHLATVTSVGTSEAEAKPMVLQTVQQIATAAQVPLSYLSKVLQTLARAGLIVSQRGLGGGFSLARAPAEITVYEVVQAVDPIQRIAQCPLGLEAHRDFLCPLHAKLDAATALVEQSFRETTIAELSATPNFGGAIGEHKPYFPNEM